MKLFYCLAVAACAVALATLCSCEKEPALVEYNFTHPDSVHYYVPYQDTSFQTVVYHAFVTHKGDTLHQWQEQAIKDCGAFGGGSCETSYMGVLVTHLWVWHAPECPQFCLNHNAIH